MERSPDYGEGGGGGGNPSPLERRVAVLEDRMDRIEARLQRIEIQLAEIVGELRQMPKASDHAALRAEVSEIRGRLANTPTTIQLFAFMITTWATGAAIVFAIVRLSN